MSWGDMGGVGPLIGGGEQELRHIRESNRIAFNTLMKVGKATGSGGAYKPTMTGANRGQVGKVSGSASGGAAGGGGGGRGKGRGKPKAASISRPRGRTKKAKKEDRSQWFKFKVKW